MPKKIKQQVSEALKAGHSPEEILSLMSHWKNPKKQALQILEDLEKETESPIAQKFKGYFQDCFQKPQPSKTPQYWDPVTPITDLHFFQEINTKLHKQHARLKSGIAKQGWVFLIISLLSGVGTASFIFVNAILWSLIFGIIFL